MIEGIRNRFVTRGWSKATAAGVPTDAVSDDNDGDDDDVFGDFEDLETGKKYESQQRNDASAKSDEALAAEERRLKKLALRAKFDAQYPSHKIEFIVLIIPCIPTSFIVNGIVVLSYSNYDSVSRKIFIANHL